MLENYGKSYTNGATEFSGGDNVWPHAYYAKQLKSNPSKTTPMRSIYEDKKAAKL